MAVNLSAPSTLDNVDGVDLTAMAAGLRYQGRDDLLLVRFSEGTKTAAVFTQNNFAAAPVVVARRHLAKAQPRAFLVNMGNANAATGAKGEQNCLITCDRLAQALDIEPDQVLPFSTGVIGEQIDLKKFVNAIELLMSANHRTDWVKAANAIMTTDTVAKGSSRQFQLDGKTVRMTGIAKGAGMIAPNMATMLAFVATDAAICEQLVSDMLKLAVDQSFNRITVDSDTSTNDAVTFSATGRARNQVVTDLGSEQGQIIYRELESLLIELATSIVRDGEGASKFVRVEVVGGRSQQDCEIIARSIADSPLVKTALFASDPNWGRLPMAIGKSGLTNLDISKIDVSVNGLRLMKSGAPDPDYTEAQGQDVFASSELNIEVRLNAGDERYHVWTSDLSHEYVSINADYRS